MKDIYKFIWSNIGAVDAAACIFPLFEIKFVLFLQLNALHLN
jgi:hypothetical protein